jgi:Rad3-related DNA helicase
MSKEPQVVNTTAPLANVATCMRAVERAVNRQEHLPGIVAFYGPSGWGKTISLTYAANHYRAYYVEAKEVWGRGALLRAILTEMGIEPARDASLSNMVDLVAEQLVKSNKPLLLDEFDHCVNRNLVEVVRDIYEGSHAAILITGEEHLEKHLRKWERFHNRVLDWVPAQPASLDDAKHLRALYCKRAKIADDLLGRIHEIAHGNVRRICVNLDRVQEFALTHSKSGIDLEGWGNREFYTGEAPKRKV